MAANGSINLVNLDFEALKESFKIYLGSQTAFKDYDLSGSNLNVLLDVLSYNTYINSFYLNMVASEMFLDSAQLRASVISHAKELNYTPRSFRSARAVVDIAITPLNPTGITAVTIPRGTSFTSKVGSNTYTFSTSDNILITGATDGVFTAANVNIYEGSLVTDTFIYNAASNEQRFILRNPTIDTTSIRTYVTEDNGSSVLVYNQANSYIGLTSTSKSFFVQAADNDLYELVFGNGVQGRLPKHGSLISAVYRVGNGELPNGCSVFSSDDAIDGHTNVRVTTVSVAVGGSIYENTNDIRKNAPRFYQTQERAVTASDYKTLLQAAYPEITAIHVFGGEEYDPPRYGKVVICADSSEADGILEIKKDEYKKYLKERCPLTIDPIFIDPEFLNVEVYTSVTYNVNSINVSEPELTSTIKTQVRLFNEFNLNNFDVTLRYSKLVKDIDGINDSIVGNDTTLLAYKDINPTLNSSEPIVIKFLQKLQSISTVSSFVHPYITNHTITSSYFTYRDNLCRLEDDGNGNVSIVTLLNDTEDHTTIVKVGTIDYTTGTINISSGLNISSYQGSSIRIRAVTESKDITAYQNNIIRIKDDDIYVTLVGERL